MIALFLGILISGCAVIDVDYDYDASYDFSNLNSYSWFEMPVDLPVDTFAMQRIKSAVDQQMKKKGFTQATGPADFIVSLQGYKNTVRQTPQSTRVSGQLTANDQFQEGAFTLTMIDAKSDRLIWEGHGKGVVAPNLSTEERTQKVNEAIAKLLTNFHPAGK